MIKRSNKRKVTLIRNSDKPRWKLSIIGMFLLVMFLLVIVRSAQLQLLNDDKACMVGKTQHEYEVELLPKRGNIRVANGEFIAMNITSYSVYANPQSVENPRDYAKKVSKILDLDEEKLIKKLRRRSSFVWVKRLTEKSEKTELERLDLEGLGFIEEPKRVYPYGPLAGQLIGFTNIDSKGIEGLEYLYDEYLAGEKSRLVIKKDGLGRTIIENPSETNTSEHNHGYDLVLTIDSQIQFIVENELSRGVDDYQAESGFSLVMDSETGAILAMASYPPMDPNNFSQYEEIYRKNLPVWKSFEPGSTLKPFVVAGAIEENLVNSKTEIDCGNGKRKIGNSIVNDVHPYSILTVSDVVRYSSNICATRIGEKLGRKKLYSYLENFGFGNKTQIDISGESTGKLRDSKDWSPIEFATICFGQGISVTGIQLVSAFSSIANKGYLMKPYIIKEIMDSKGNIVRRFRPEILRRVISYDTARVVSQMLEKAVDSGTGKNAKIEFFRVAGKTGTAQVPDPVNGGYYQDRFISSFVGFSPLESPNITVLVVLENSKKGFYGGVVAAPIFREITKRILNYMELVPNGAIANSLVMPNLVGKSRREILKWSENNGIKVELSGSGFAVTQNPPPGENINLTNVCSVKLEQTI